MLNPPYLSTPISSQQLQEKVKEGNLDPRERTVAMEAQVGWFPHTAIPSLISLVICDSSV